MSRAHPTDGRIRRSARALGLGALIGSAAVGSAAACAREPLPDICPDVDKGELVISELRGDQDGNDSFGHYIEIYNAAGRTVDLQGMWVRLISSTGAVVELFVRESLELEAGGYAVIGPGLDDDVQSFIDYPIAWDISGGDPEQAGSYPRDLLRYGSGFVEVEACDVVIDAMFYPDAMLIAADQLSLPRTGTLACGNAENPPRADANDDSRSGCWCVDDQDAGGQPLFGLGLPGTPGGPNRCP